jgi:hypothetical protein
MLSDTVLNEELAFCFVVGMRFVFVALSFSRLTLGYFQIRFDNYMFIETNLLFEYISEEHHLKFSCTSFKGKLTGAHGSMFEALGYKPEGYTI